MTTRYGLYASGNESQVPLIIKNKYWIRQFDTPKNDVFAILRCYCGKVYTYNTFNSFPNSTITCQCGLKLVLNLDYERDYERKISQE